MENIDETKNIMLNLKKYTSDAEPARNILSKNPTLAASDFLIVIPHLTIGIQPVVELPHRSGSAAAMVVPASVLSSTHTLPP